MQPSILPPSKKLQSIVQRFEFYKIDADSNTEHSFLLLPSFDNGLIFLFYEDKPFILKSEVLDYVPVPASNLLPTVSIPSYNYGLRKLKAIRVLFQPSALSVTFDISIKSHQSAVLELRELDKELHFIQEKLAETTNHVSQRSIIESYLLKRLRFKNFSKTFFAPLHQAILNSGYGTTIPKLAREIGLSTRHLNRLLNEQVGFSLTEFKRVHRFCRVIHYLNQPTIPTFTEIAYNFDYYDQAHFIRDFKRMSYHAPSSYLKAIGKEHQLLFNSLYDLDYSGVLIHRKNRRVRNWMD